MTASNAAGSARESPTRPVRSPHVASPTDRDARLRRVLDEHADFTVRALRRFGVTGAVAEDAAQQVAIVMARKLAGVPEGAERQYLFGVVRRVAWTAHRQASRHGEHLGEELNDAVDAAPNPEQVLERQRACALVARTLQHMPVELRTVFVLHDIEEMSMADIAVASGIPAGTVASRLRRARAIFSADTATFGREESARKGK